MTNNLSDLAFEALKAKNKDITFPTVYHDTLHAVTHFAFDGDLSKKLPTLGTSPHHEAIVTITQCVLLNYHALLDTDGLVLGATRGSSSVYKKQSSSITKHDLTLEEMKAILAIEVLVDEKTAAKANHGQEFFKNFPENIDGKTFKQDFLQWAMIGHKVDEKGLYDFYHYRNPLADDATVEQAKQMLLDEPAFELSPKEEVKLNWRKHSATKVMFGDIGDYKNELRIDNFEQSDAKLKCDAIDKQIAERNFKCPISDQALECYMMRAELIKQQLQPYLEKKKCSNIFELEYLDFHAIPPKLFAVSKAEVMAALEEKHGIDKGNRERFSIATNIKPANQIISASALHQAPAEPQLQR